MMRLPRSLTCVTLACCLSAPVLYSIPSYAQEEPATQPAADASPQEADASLRKAVEAYWHYGKIARYDLAAMEGEKILAANAQPVEIMQTFQAVAAERKDDLFQWLLRWQGIEPMRDVTTELINRINKGYGVVRSDLRIIEENLQRMSSNERAYQLGLQRLRESGELAVPVMLDYLKDPAKSQYHTTIRRAMRDMGRAALNPLLAATEMKNQDILIMVISALGDIGYDVAQPYLVRLANGSDSPSAVRDAAGRALMRMGVQNPQSLNAADQFHDLSERFYYDNAGLSGDNRAETSFIWYWNDQNGLAKKDVPSPIFNEIMAMRAAEYAVKLNPAAGKSISLWLASNNKREAELPQDAVDPTREQGQPNAHYYNVSAGAQYLNDVLARALRDRNSAVALRATKSLQEIVGQSNLFPGDQSRPLIDAMQYPDRLVRFEAAMALAAALPRQSFNEQERVVPILAEAVAQTGRPNILVLASSQDQVNSLVKQMTDSGYNAVGGVGAAAAVSSSASLPSVDLILMSPDVKISDIDELEALAGQTPRLEQSARLAIISSNASPLAARPITNPLFNVTQSADAEGLKSAIDQARRRSGSLSLDEQAATSYSLRAAELLGRLAISDDQVLDLTPAESNLLLAIGDARPEVAMAAGNVLGFLNFQQSQPGLLTQAADDQTPPEVKISLFKSLATNAKFFGNKLGESRINTLRDVAEKGAALDIRAAAAEALGALNLPANQARELIVNQSRV